MSEEVRSKEYPSNSISSRTTLRQEERKERPKPEKVVSSPVITKKPSFAKKFSNFFLGSDSKTVTDYVVCDILIPAIKNTIVEAIYAVSDGIGGGFEMLFFGERGNRRRANMRRDNQKSYVSYESSYNNIRARQVQTVRPNDRARHDFDDIIIANRGEAEEVLSHLVDLIVDYGSASVADLYSLVDMDSDYTDRRYGWTDLRGACVVRVPNGYLLDLPRTIVLD